MPDAKVRARGQRELERVAIGADGGPTASYHTQILAHTPAEKRVIDFSRSHCRRARAFPHPGSYEPTRDPPVTPPQRPDSPLPPRDQPASTSVPETLQSAPPVANLPPTLVPPPGVTPAESPVAQTRATRSDGLMPAPV